MLLFVGFILILFVCVFLLVQPYDVRYLWYYFPVVTGGGSLLVIINEYVQYRRLFQEKKCHHCKRHDIVLNKIIASRITKYWLCNECPKKMHLLLRRGGTIIAVISIMIFFVEPISAHVIYFLSMIAFNITRGDYLIKQYFSEGRCYVCRRHNDTVRFIQTKYTSAYFVCYECPLKNDALSTESSG